MTIWLATERGPLPVGGWRGDRCFVLRVYAPAYSAANDGALDIPAGDRPRGPEPGET